MSLKPSSAQSEDTASNSRLRRWFQLLLDTVGAFWADDCYTKAAALSYYAVLSVLPLLILLVPMIMAGHWSEPYLGLLDPAFYGALVSAFAIAVLPAMIALLLRARRLSERQVREQERRRYAYEERLRIARDVHDVVGHSLAVITLQAGVALHLLDKERPAQAHPDRVAESLEAIKKTSREALAELRTTLEVFPSDSAEPRSPSPGLARLDALLDGLRAAGAVCRQGRAALGHILSGRDHVPSSDRLRPAGQPAAHLRFYEEPAPTTD